jgi:protein-S-isoprenylcysteine O-methyltransferase Ste14
MKITDSLARDGALLFRWRSYLPLLLLLPLVPALQEARHVEALVGDRIHDAWVVACYLVSVAGLAVRWCVVAQAAPGTSGRNVDGQRADALNRTGLYSVVRHPIYLGNFLALAGVAMSTMVWWFAFLACLAYWLYIERIMAAEERFLEARFGADFAGWAARTPAFVPRLSGWTASDRPVAWRTVLKREYNGVLAVAAAYLAIEVLVDIVVAGEPVSVWVREDLAWPLGFGLSLLAFLLLRFLKKRTGVLDAAC